MTSIKATRSTAGTPFYVTIMVHGMMTVSWFGMTDHQTNDGERRYFERDFNGNWLES
ncbi:MULTISPECIES: hypothetical protein [unclassified Microbacterium]|uniref:hypothetical protein n=1 Tax=unclassified Microbacterium TaxID=2609290 RepID=UPI00214BCFD4|nr:MULTISPECIES: hypothetical protein [unclassified Microbacterium]MCR2800780.1 hypothetical protein [Microbacterium sp. zg.Y818]MCR2825468.1 hypothetical protein [Microbacterium sp. zg.Y909]WIM23501.1 hypothetical protein QNO21_05560 [Microbacterium sp. zg-Y818]